MAGAGSEVDGVIVIPGRAKREPGIHSSTQLAARWIPGSSLRSPRNDGGGYFESPPLLSKNTPCSPNMFQNHQGRFSRKGRP